MPVLKQGGVEVLVRTLIEETFGKHECHLISTDDTATMDASPLRGLIHGHLHVPVGPIPRSWFPKMLEWLRRHRIDLCHFHLSGTYDMGSWSVFSCPMKLAAIHGFTAVVTNHQAVSFFSADRPPGFFLRKCAAQAAMWPGKALQLYSAAWEANVSQHDLALTNRFYPFFRDKLVQVYHSRLDVAASVLPIPPTRRILNVATIAFRKGQHILVEAFSRIASDFPEWSLDLVGFKAEAACVSRIEDIIRSVGLEKRIRLHGPHPDPTDFYRRAEIYVQPSLLEGLGLSLQEAMFHGRACVGAETGGIPELINDPSIGMLHEPGNPGALADTLTKLMKDEDLRTRMGMAARDSILNRGMTRQAMAASYLALYRKALGA